MESLSYRVALRTVKTMNVILAAIPVLLVCLLYYWPEGGLEGRIRLATMVLMVYLLLYMTYGRIYGSFYISMLRISEMVYSQILTLILSDGVLYVILCLICRNYVPIWPMAVVLGIQSVLAVLWCVCAHKWYYRTYPPDERLSSMTRRCGWIC